MSKTIRCHTDCDGWDIFETSPTVAEIQKCDDCGRFESDDAARLHVGRVLLKLNENQSIVGLMEEATK